MTQAELGKAVGRSESAIKHIETGEMKLVNLALMDKLVSTLQIEDKMDYDDDYIQFIKNNPAAQIKAYRKKKNITTCELSKRLKLDHSAVKKWEDGKSVLSRTSYEKLLELFNEGSPSGD